MNSMKVAVADARKNFAELIETVRKGGRVRITRHGKPVAWLIGREDRDQITSEPRPQRAPASVQAPIWDGEGSGEGGE
jgi:prevent-host-death family protein